jgi:hypothetical protein
MIFLFFRPWETCIGNNVYPPSENMAKKQSFLVSSLLENLARKQCSFFCPNVKFISIVPRTGWRPDKHE